jgi:hypothetical protein
MTRKASITVFRPLEEVEHRWNDTSDGPRDLDASVRFARAPGDRGTEIQLELAGTPVAGKLGETVMKLTGSDPLAHAKDELRRFKQLVETGVIAQSDSTLGGERLDRKFAQRPAQPVADVDLQKAGV